MHGSRRKSVIQSELFPSASAMKIVNLWTRSFELRFPLQLRFMSVTISRPAQNEYAPYYHEYIARIPECDILEYLEKQRQDVLSMLCWVADEEWGTFRYEPGKWSVSDIIGHLNDGERIFATRALRIARGDKTPLPGWDQDEYAFVAGAEGREVDDLSEEFDFIRRSTIAMLKSFEPEAFNRSGVANNVEVTVRAIAFIIAGHTDHHLRILRERYRVRA